MTTDIYRLSREFDNGRIVSATIAGHASLDDVIDVMRGFIVQMGYPPEVAARLQLVEPGDAGLTPA